MTAHRSRSSFNKGKAVGIIVVTCLGPAVGLLSLLVCPIRDRRPTTDTIVQIDVAPDSPNHSATLLDTADMFISGDPSLPKEVLPAQVGTMQNLEDPSQPDFQGIDPEKTQAEQGLDDSSGLTYPCVFSPGAPDVCQRRLTESEVKERGLF